MSSSHFLHGLRAHAVSLVIVTIVASGVTAALTPLGGLLGALAVVGIAAGIAGAATVVTIVAVQAQLERKIARLQERPNDPLLRVDAHAALSALPSGEVSAFLSRHEYFDALAIYEVQRGTVGQMDDGDVVTNILFILAPVRGAAS